jgi:hypothetical protein
LSLSLIGFIFVGFLLIYPVSTYSVLLRKQIIGFIFGSLCILGVFAVFFPNRCSDFGAGRRSIESNKAYVSTKRYSKILGIKFIHGHHDSNVDFSRHEFQIRSKSICAGCFGLLIGALVSLGGIIVYSTGNIDLEGFALYTTGLGVFAVASALILPIVTSGYPIIRILINSWFVIGMLFILIGIDSLTMNLEIDLLLIGFFIIWMMSRIVISRFNHKRIYSVRNL